MGKKLAIRGHSTRGKEVIELFKMMGARHFILDGITDWYVINDLDNSITFHDNNYINCHEYVKFTLEEFLEKYPYKVGDKVMDGHGNSLTIKSMEWHDELETMVYAFEESDVVLTAEYLLKHNAEFLVNKEKSDEADKMLTGFILDHLHRNHLKNVLSELYGHIKTTPKEELEREFKEIESEGWTNVGPTVEEFMTFCECVNKKSKYPTTYVECCEILDFCGDYFLTTYDAGCMDKREVYGILQQVNSLTRLLICKSAYYKIAGEEMGLGKPWEPDWVSGKPFYCISVSENIIGKGKWYIDNKILAFPTEEMRDTFYENFKDLIEQCKELL